VSDGAGRCRRSLDRRRPRPETSNAARCSGGSRPNA
jgi:hypothetical protein